VKEMEIVPEKAVIAVFDISDETSVLFLNVPMGYCVTQFEINGILTRQLGRLKQFNRLKCISHWKTEENPNLVKTFVDALNERNWPFDLYPNPLAFFVYVPKPPTE